MKKLELYPVKWAVKAGFIIFCLVFLFSPFLLLAQPNLTGQENQEKEHESIVEKVTVTNVEVPVRVLSKGLPVTNLTRDDFTIFEDNKKVEINGFFLNRKTLKVPVSGEVTTTSAPAKPRTFVLVFSITDFNDHIREAIRHLFDKTFRADDRLLIFANDKTLEFHNLTNADEIKNQLLNDLQQESNAARNRLSTYINRIETYLNVSDFRAEINRRRDNPADRMVDFLKKYLITWNEYKLKYLTPNVDRFYFFARYLEQLKGEKWVLNFYQFELFPNIRLSGITMNLMRDLATVLIESKDSLLNAQGRLVNTLLNQLAMDLVVSKSFPTEEVSKLFYKVDATFHSFFIKSMKITGGDEVDYQEVSSEIEKTLKQITDITGGKNITSNNLVQSIETITEIEDAYYILTYVPPDRKKTGKLKVKVKGKGYKVLYDDNFRADYIADYLKKKEEQLKTPDIKIVDFSFKGKILAFTIKDYLMRPVQNNTVGQMKIRIRVTNRDENKVVFDEEKVLTAQKAEMKISLGAFKTLQKGEYNFLIDAADMFTGKEDNLHQNAVVKR